MIVLRIGFTLVMYNIPFINKYIYNCCDYMMSVIMGID